MKTRNINRDENLSRLTRQLPSRISALIALALVACFVTGCSTDTDTENGGSQVATGSGGNPPPPPDKGQRGKAGEFLNVNYEWQLSHRDDEVVVAMKYVFDSNGASNSQQLGSGEWIFSNNGKLVHEHLSEDSSGRIEIQDAPNYLGLTPIGVIDLGHTYKTYVYEAAQVRSKATYGPGDWVEVLRDGSVFETGNSIKVDWSNVNEAGLLLGDDNKAQVLSVTDSGLSLTTAKGTVFTMQ